MSKPKIKLLNDNIGGNPIIRFGFDFDK